MLLFLVAPRLEASWVSIDGRMVKKIGTHVFEETLVSYEKNELDLCVLIQENIHGIINKWKEQDAEFRI